MRNEIDLEEIGSPPPSANMETRLIGSSGVIGSPGGEKLINEKRSIKVLVTGLPGSGKRTWMRNVYLHNTPDKAAACVRYSEAINKYIMASYNSVVKTSEDLKLKGNRGSTLISESSSTDLGRFVPGMSRIYQKEMKAVGFLEHVAHHHYDASGRITQPDYIPTVVDCLIIDSEHACDSDEFTIIHDNTEYSFFVVEHDQLATIATKPYCDDLTLVVDVIDASSMDNSNAVEKALGFYAAINRLPSITNTENKFMTVPVVMVFNKFDVLETIDLKKFDLKAGFENFKGRKNIETIKEFIKTEFYIHTHGDREVFSCFKSSLSTSNDIMMSIARAAHKVIKKREMSKILKLSTKLNVQRILSGETHTIINLGNPDSHSEIPFDRIAWKDLLSLARALGPPAPTLSHLTQLNLRNNNLGPRGAQLLAESLSTCRSLTSLRLASNELLDEGTKFLAELLEKNASVLLELTLTNNVISDEGAEALASALCKNTTLTLIDLSDNFIRDVGASALVNSAQANQQLRVLNLWRNRIQTFTLFDQLFRTNRTLTELNFAMNASVDGLSPNVHSLMRVLSLMADNYASGLVHLSFDAGNTFNNTSAEYCPPPEEARSLAALLARHRARAERAGSENLIDTVHELTHYDYSHGIERILDWSNNALSYIEMPDLGWGAGTMLITELYLDNNSLHEFPLPILDLRSLRTLVLGSNELINIPPEIQLLTNLMRLDLSCNEISVLPPTVGALASLKILDIRYNMLYSLVDEVCDIVNLEWLLVQQNNLTTLPSHIFNLTRLSSLEVHGNPIPAIKAIIYNAWVAETVELDLSGFDLTVLPLEIGNLTPLTILLLNDNSLTSLPPAIGNLANLRVLDLRNNKLDSIAWQIGNLPNLEYLRLEGNSLSQIPSEIRNKDLLTIKQYLKSLASGEEECFRMKLMLVGAENVGKTTTSRILREEMDGTSGKKKQPTAAAPNISTDGIDVHQWEYEEEGYAPVTLGIWDFAGQEVYYTTHQFFLTTRSIYVIVFNMIASEETMRIEYWLQSVKFAAPTAPIIILGTHADHSRCTPEYIEYVSALIQRYISRFRNVKGFFPVSCKTRKGFESVRSTIVNLARAQPPAVTRFPRSYLTLEGLIVSERRLRTPPVITFDMFEDMALQCGAPKGTLKTVAAFLNELGAIVWVDDPRLSSMVILDPQWLAKLMATLITSKMNFVNNGILERKNLTFLWKPPDFPESLHTNLVNLLEQFEILYKMPSSFGASEETEKYLLMCLVSDKRPPLEWPRPGMTEDKPYSMRIYQLPFVPLGLMSKLMTRILHFVTPSTYWKDGMVAELGSNELLLEFLPLKNQIAIHVIETVGKNADLAPTLRLLMENFDNLIEGYYRIKREIFLCCTHCLTQRKPTPHLFSFEAVENAAATGQTTLVCEVDSDKVVVHISAIAPDLVLSDLEHIRMEYKDLHDLKKLGEGAFGVVYKAQYKNEEIAFKQLNMTGAVNPAELYAELRREVWLSSGLRHPNIVALKGMCFEPYGMAMEFIPHGNLYDWLRKDAPNGGRTIGWEMRFKIAMDLASGMRFLHNATPKIIHRDFKSPNVLMSLTKEATCKVSDFGASRAVAKCFGRSDLGNPSWLAPEIMKGESYTEKADIFSYGIVLWELLTHEHPYSEHPVSTDKFLTRFEQAIIGGLRPSIPADCVPEFSSLVTRCWDTEPSKRPPFDEIYYLLCQARRRLFPDFAVGEEERAASAFMTRTAVTNNQQLSTGSRAARAPMRSESIVTSANRKSGNYTGLNMLMANQSGVAFKTFSQLPQLSQSSLPLMRDTTTNPHSINTASSTSSSGSATNTRGVRTHQNTFVRKEGLEGGQGPVAMPIVRLDSGSAAGPSAVAGSVDALIGQFYFAKQLDPRLSPVSCLCFVPTMRQMWAGCHDGSISVYNVDNYQLVEDRSDSACQDPITCMLFDNKDAVWCGSSDAKIYVWDVKTKKKKVLNKHKGPITCLESSSNSNSSSNSSSSSSSNKYVVSGSLDQVFRVWDAKTCAVIKKVEANMGPITALVMQEELLWVAAGQKVATFNARTFKPLREYDAHKQTITCMAVVNNQVWSCSEDSTILVWNSETQGIFDELEYPHVIQCLLPSRNGLCVYAGTKNKSVVVWNTKTLKMVREQTRHDGAVLALAKGVDNYIWSGSQDKTNCIWQEVDDSTRGST